MSENKFSLLKRAFRFFLTGISVTGFVLFVYFWPRFLIKTLKEDSPWIGYLYTYGLGLLIFAFTGFMIFSFHSSYPEKRKQDRFWLLVLLGVLIFGMALHGAWIHLTVSYPFKGIG